MRRENQQSLIHLDDVVKTYETGAGGVTVLKEVCLDVRSGELWALPWLGRAAWESAAALEVSRINRTHVAILVGDDRGDAPLLLYVGRKAREGNFVERNGLANGKLYMWVSDTGDRSPADWSGTGTSRTGRFVEEQEFQRRAVLRVEAEVDAARNHRGAKGVALTRTAYGT